jgi:hypothetical protein
MKHENNPPHPRLATVEDVMSTMDEYMDYLATEQAKEGYSPYGSNNGRQEVV